jgi:hypothetical protein
MPTDYDRLRIVRMAKLALQEGQKAISVLIQRIADATRREVQLSKDIIILNRLAFESRLSGIQMFEGRELFPAGRDALFCQQREQKRPHFDQVIGRDLVVKLDQIISVSHLMLDEHGAARNVELDLATPVPPIDLVR